MKAVFCWYILHILLMLAFADRYTYNHSKMHYCVNTIHGTWDTWNFPTVIPQSMQCRLLLVYLVSLIFSAIVIFFPIAHHNYPLCCISKKHFTSVCFCLFPSHECLSVHGLLFFVCPSSLLQKHAGNILILPS